MLAPGRKWGDLTDGEVGDLAARFGASHVVFPAGRPLDFVPVYANADWALYMARRLPLPPPPQDVTNAELWHSQERFMKEVVFPNIERFRKSDVSIALKDGEGRPLRGVRYEVAQTRNGFLFGSALPHFSRPAERADFDCGVVDRRELDRFLEIFNFSVIGYSGKWSCTEPLEGMPDYADLDGYVAWCASNRVAMEFHFVTGYEPKWVTGKPAEGRQAALLERTRQLFERYGDRIRYWQVVNEKHLLQESVAAFEWIRGNHPDASLGISDCARFYSAYTNEPQRSRDLLRGKPEIEWLALKGVDCDFFGFHGHRPFGVWPDARSMYDALDAFRAAGVKVHITEFGVHLNCPVIGPLRGGTWTPELQAEYYRYYFTVCFSHPAVEAINFWGTGPRTWMGGAGLLDKDYNPKPAFHALRDLITKEWRTRLRGRTGAEGAIRFRGFHGDYELVLVSPRSGRALRREFSVEEGSDSSAAFRWDRDSDSLCPVAR
jgi:GH35 family endo-1,4-beta-xylanase